MCVILLMGLLTLYCCYRVVRSRATIRKRCSVRTGGRARRVPRREPASLCVLLVPKAGPGLTVAALGSQEAAGSLRNTLSVESESLAGEGLLVTQASAGANLRNLWSSPVNGHCFDLSRLKDLHVGLS